MTKIMRRLAVIALVFVCIFSLSCGLNTGEAKNSSAKVVNSYQEIKGVVGMPLNTALVPITWQNATVVTNSNTTTGLVNKSVMIEPTVSGVSATVSSVVNSVIYVKFSGTPEETMKDSIKITLPKEFFQNRISPLTVDCNNLKWNIVPSDELYVGQSQTSDLSITNVNTKAYTSNKSSIADVTLTLTARNAVFNKIEDTDVSSWFSPAVKGLTYTVTDNKEGSTSITIVISGTPLENSTASLVKVTIPRGTLKKVNSDGTLGEDYNYAYDATVRLSNKVALSVYARVQDAVRISGFTSKNMDREINTTEVNISLSGTAFATLGDNTDVSSWFSPVVSGLSYRLKNGVVAGANSCTVVISGSPEVSADTEMSIAIPIEQTLAPSNVVTTPTLVVDAKGSSYYIRKDTSFTDVDIYDLATFGDVNLSMISPNRELTTKANGDAASFEKDTYRLLNTTTSTATLVGGLARRGYKLVGFNKRSLDSSVSTDVTKLDYAVGKEVTVATNGDITIAIKDSDKGEKVKLYAIWEVDADAWGWTKNADGSYNKTTDTSEGGKYLPATFDLDKAYPGDENAELRTHYVSYPYYKEAKVLAKGLKAPGNMTDDYTDVADEEFTYDFAIGEQAVTGYMLDVLREWNIGTGSSSSPEKGYELPEEQSDITQSINSITSTAENKVAYGGTYYSSAPNYRANNEKSEPLTSVSATQAVLIANAMTAYYNDRHGYTNGAEGYLDYAYVMNDGSEVKTLTDAASLFTTVVAGASIAKEGAKGFRLPTSREWDLAARIVPQSDYEASLTGAHNKTASASRNYLYPQIHRSNMWSGANIIASADSNNPQADTWVWYAYNSSEYGENLGSTHGFIKTAISGKPSYPGTVLDKAPNNIGVYGMSGNVWEWCGTSTGSGSARLRGGSFNGNASSTRVGYLSNISASARYGIYGLRLARGL